MKQFFISLRIEIIYVTKKLLTLFKFVLLALGNVRLVEKLSEEIDITDLHEQTVKVTCCSKFTWSPSQDQVPDMEQNPMSDYELQDLEEGDRLGYHRRNPDSASGKEVIEVHDGVDSEVQPDNPGIEGRSIDIRKNSIVEGRHMMVPSILD